MVGAIRNAAFLAKVSGVTGRRRDGPDGRDGTGSARVEQAAETSCPVPESCLCSAAFRRAKKGACWLGRVRLG